VLNDNLKKKGRDR